VSILLGTGAFASGTNRYVKIPELRRDLWRVRFFLLSAFFFFLFGGGLERESSLMTIEKSV